MIRRRGFYRGRDLKENLIRHSPDSRSDSETQRHHDKTGEQNSGHDRDCCFFPVHVEQTCGERSSPRASSGQRYSHEQKEREIKPSSGFFLQRLAAAMTFLKAETANPADEPLVLPPFQKLPREQKNERHRKHISQHTYGKQNNKSRWREFNPLRRKNAYPEWNCPAKLNQRNHRDKKRNKKCFGHKNIILGKKNKFQCRSPPCALPSPAFFEKSEKKAWETRSLVLTRPCGMW